MTWKGRIAIFCLLILFPSLIYLSWLIGVWLPSSSSIIEALLSFILTGIGAIIVTLIAPIRHLLDKFVSENILAGVKECRIAIFGMPGTGKTSLITQLLTQDYFPKSKNQLTRFNSYTHDFRLGLDSQRRIRVSLSDYPGSKLSEVTVYTPSEFFGVRDKRKANFVIFLVDLFPELNNWDGQILSLTQCVQEIGPNISPIIEQRVLENCKYLNEFTLEPFFEITHSNVNLYTIVLIINKVDILTVAKTLGYLSNIDESEYVSQLYSPLITTLKRICEEKRVKFSVHLISTFQGRSVKSVMGELLQRYVEIQDRNNG